MSNYRNPRILALARDHSCQCCGADDNSIVAAHSNSQAHGKGMGIKASDLKIAYLCASCHSFVDTGRASRGERNLVWYLAHIKTVPLFRHLLDKRGLALLAADEKRNSETEEV